MIRPQHVTMVLSGTVLSFLPVPLLAADLPESLPEALSAALSEAAVCEDFTPSFSLRATTDEGALAMRYEAGEEGGWSMLEGDLETLDKDAREEVENMQQGLSEPCELTYHDLGETISAATLLSESADDLIYAVTLKPDTDGMPDAMREAVETRLHLDPRGGHITRIAMHSTRPFKPIAVAKVDLFRMEQDFTRLPDGAVVLTRMHNHMSGSAMFRKFEEGFTLEFSDFALPPETQPEQGVGAVNLP